MRDENQLRDKLLALDSAGEETAKFRTQRESEIKAMFEETLSTPRRIGYATVAVLSAGFALLVLNGALSDELPWLVRMIAWFAVGAGVAIMLVTAFSAIRGRRHRQRQSQLLITIAGILLAGMGTAFLRVGAEGDPNWNNVMLQTTGWILLGLLAVSVLMHYMEMQQLKTQAKLLELELRLAQIAERLEKR